MEQSKCETGWGDGLIQLDATVGDERPSPHPAAPFSRVDPPPQGEGENGATPIQFQTATTVIARSNAKQSIAQ